MNTKNTITRIKKYLETNKNTGIIIASISFVIILLFSMTTIYKLFELRLYDLRFNLKPATTQCGNLAFIDMDNDSINNIGKFPWPRSLYAKALDVLEEVGTRQVAFDTEFPDESPQMVEKDEMNILMSKISQKRKIKTEDLDKAILNNDQVLASKIKNMKGIILPFSFLNDKLVERDIDENTKKEIARARKLFIERASVPVPPDKIRYYKNLIDPERKDILPPIPKFINAGKAFGFVDSDLDMDGSARRGRIVRMFDGRIYFHMAFIMMMDLCHVKKEDIIIIPGDKITLKNAVNPITHIKEDINIPIDDMGMMIINWAGTYESSFQHIPFLIYWNMAG